MNASRNFGTALLLGLVGVLVGIVLLVIFIFPLGAGSGDQNEREPARAAQTQEDPAQDDQNQDNTTNNDQAQNDQNQEVSRETAGEIAVEHLGEGEVTGISREEDHGALWEVEVTGPDGSEADVYVAANGDVTHVNQKGTGEEAGNDGAQQPEQQQPAPEQPQEINMQQAAEIAASHVGGTVDTITAESDGDYGAAWDADVYSAEGEYTIYISATGEIMHVEGPFNE